MQLKSSLHLAAAAVLVAALIPAVRAQGEMPREMHERARWLTDRTTEDLQRFVHRDNLDPQDRQRLDAALHDLHAFRENVGPGHFDREVLTRAIDNIEAVANHASLGEHERTTLHEDIHRLRDLRDHWHE